jgi:hypothetical protein
MQFGLNYRGGPLSVEKRVGVPDHVARAGDRAPDAPLLDEAGRPCRLFDCFRGPHFTLLATGADNPPALAPKFDGAVRQYRIVPPGQGGGMIDRDGHVRRNYGEGLILVRPDGYVGYAGPVGIVDDLNSYLGRFFG